VIHLSDYQIITALTSTSTTTTTAF